MNDFEDTLRQALRREEPSPRFAEKVLERIRSAPPRPVARPLRFSWRPWMAAAAALVVLGLGGEAYRHQRQLRLRTEADQAQAQLRLALEISSEKLNVAFKKLDSLPED